MDIEFIRNAFLTMLVAIDPPGLAPIFLAVTGHMTMAERRSTAYRAVIIAFCILVAAALGGKALLTTLGISIPAFRIAGGLLLFYIAAEMIFERREQRKVHSAEASIAHDHPQSVAAFPLAIPMMAGPGAITATIIQASNAEGNWVNLLSLIGVLLVIILSCLMVFLLASRIDKILGMTGRVVLSRLLGVLLAALAVQIIGDGIFAFHASVTATK
jgi:multiple antibiotic resistance protein